ncbi:thioredoxin-like protein 1 isoform X2 [Mercenaria mercenaria]|uniref:thioredoxin-like protein 1 isoform X1 n=1 Tax=Mercenaria mercenaria TaxID=6596 RepID=UPI00234E9D0C|nr:thioredoxin-like protein 1 isoform X1 [Mercenaria mercenaria]XP_053386921.1 thioredoxin-like protein 1 isoform X2 [Mercenaria mercenaria]
MTGQIRTVETDADFDVELTNAGTKLVVVDFFATWCGPCRNIAPVYVQLSMKYPKAVFLKVDVDKCQETAGSQGVSAMPTFIFYRNKTKIDLQRGADPNALEEKIKKWYGEGDEDGGDEVMVKGHMDLSSFINKSGCECLNESDDNPLAHCLTAKGGYLESDCDEQLLLSIEFTQPVKLHSLKLYGPKDKGPKTVKVFQNQPRSLDFDSADSMTPTQQLDLTPEDTEEGKLVQLKYVKFQNVSNITLFIKDNFEGGEVTQLDYLGFIGTPVGATNMSDFKRVAGKKGESH